MPSNKKNTINHAILEVFKREGKPLTVKEVYYRIAEDNLYTFNTSTPENIVRTALRRFNDSLDFPSSRQKKLYTLLADGRYWLVGNEKVESKNQVKKDEFEKLKVLHKRYLQSFKADLLVQSKKMDWRSFEVFCKGLLQAYGFKNLKVTRAVKDKGIDGHGELKIGLASMPVAYQCKRWNNTSIGRPDVQQFRGEISGDYQQGFFFTTSKFTKEAKEVSFKRGAVPIVLIDGPGIVDIMIEKGYGVDVEELVIYSNSIDLIMKENF